MTLKIDFRNELEFADEPEKCKGVYFKYTKSSFWSKNSSIEKRESYRMLKSRSCKGGCGKSCLRDLFEDDISTSGFDSVELVRPNEPQMGSIYKLRFVIASQDENGIIDDWYWVLD